MKISREELLGHLSSVSPGLSPKETIEQSACFVFKDGYVMTFNDEIACRHKTIKGITGAVQAAPLISVLSKMPDDELDIEQRDTELLILGKRKKAGICMDKEIALPIDKVERPEKWLPLPDKFAEAVEMVEHCASKDLEAFSITCLHLHPNWIEASDSFQAARYKLKTGLENPMLVRRESIKHIVSLGMDKMSETKNWIHFKSPIGMILSCRKFIEDYPDLTSIYKVKGEPATLPKGLGDAADLAAEFSKGSMDDQILVDLKPGKVRVKGQGAFGWSSEVLKIRYDGEPMSFMASPKMLKEIAKRHNECELAKDRLKVNGSSYCYISMLQVAED